MYRDISNSQTAWVSLQRIWDCGRCLDYELLEGKTRPQARDSLPPPAKQRDEHSGSDDDDRTLKGSDEADAELVKKC